LVTNSSCFMVPPPRLAVINDISRLLPPPCSIQATRPPPTARRLMPSPEQPRIPGFTLVDLRSGPVQTTIRRAQARLTSVVTAALLPSAASRRTRPLIVNTASGRRACPKDWAAPAKETAISPTVARVPARASEALVWRCPICLSTVGGACCDFVSPVLAAKEQREEPRRPALGRRARSA